MPMQALDTRKTAKTLAEAGFDAKQAEAGALRDAVTENAAAKPDIEGIGRRLETVDGRFDGIDKRLDKMCTRLAGMDKRLEKMDRRLEVMDARLESMATKADLYRALSVLFGGTVLANAAMIALVIVAGYSAGGP